MDVCGRGGHVLSMLIKPSQLDGEGKEPLYMNKNTYIHKYVYMYVCICLNSDSDDSYDNQGRGSRLQLWLSFPLACSLVAYSRALAGAKRPERRSNICVHDGLSGFIVIIIINMYMYV